MRPHPDTADQVRALTRSFLARFFESEITTGADDLKSAFFWLLAALATPGLFIPWIMVFDWHMIAMFQGADLLREASRAEKVFYLGLSMIASGLLTALAWNSLLPDRRDTLILGALPVQPRTIVAAKIAALAGYILIVNVAMHAIGAVCFGAILSTNSPFSFLVRGIVAHFAVSCAAGASVALLFAAAQGLTLAAVGPALFRRAAVVLQVGLVALVALGLGTLPAITSATVQTVRGFGTGVQPWILSTPPLWFLGLYEWLLGTSDPLIAQLARYAAAALVGPAVIVALTYPFAYRRLLTAVVETGDRPGRSVVARACSAAVVVAAGRQPEVRGVAQFFTATLARVARHRFVLAVVTALAMVWGIPGWRTFVPGAGPQAGLLALPLVTMMFLLVGLRLAASLPANVHAGWLFEMHGPSRADARRAMERMLLLLGVVPIVAASTVLYGLLWGPTVAGAHALIAVAAGVALIELLIWRLEGMPCGQRWNPARLDLGRRWPLHAVIFLLIAVLLPKLEMLLFRSHTWTAIFALTLATTAAAIRHASATHTMAPSYDDVDPVAGVLRLQ